MGYGSKPGGSVKVNLSYQIIYKFITIITPLITTPVISRALGAEKLGVYSATLAYVNYFMLLAMLGVENYGTRSIAAQQGHPEKLGETFWNIYAVQAISATLALTLYAASMLLIKPERQLIAALQGLWIVSNLLNINWFFLGTEQIRLTVIRNAVVKLFSVLLTVTLVRTPDDLYKYVLIMAGDAVLSSILVWPFLRRSIGFCRPRLALMKRHIKPILLLFVPILAMSIFHVMDKTMLDLLSTERDVGFYYAADKMINIPLAVITAIGTVMLPRVASTISRGDQANVKSLLRKSAEVTIFLTCAIGIGIASVAREFVPVFFGEGYDPCVLLVFWFTPVLFVKAVSDLIRMQFLIPAREDRIYILAVTAGAVSNLAANFILIRLFGALGAVLGTLIAEGVVLLAEYLAVREQIPFARYLLQNIFYFAMGGVMLLAVRGTAGILALPPVYKLVVMVACGGLVYLIGCVLYWRVRRESVFHEIALRFLPSSGRRPPE